MGNVVCLSVFEEPGKLLPSKLLPKRGLFLDPREEPDDLV